MPDDEPFSQIGIVLVDLEHVDANLGFEDGWRRGNLD